MTDDNSVRRFCPVLFFFYVDLGKMIDGDHPHRDWDGRDDAGTLLVSKFRTNTCTSWGWRRAKTAASGYLRRLDLARGINYTRVVAGEGRDNTSTESATR